VGNESAAEVLEIVEAASKTPAAAELEAKIAELESKLEAVAAGTKL